MSCNIIPMSTHETQASVHTRPLQMHTHTTLTNVNTNETQTNAHTRCPTSLDAVVEVGRHKLPDDCQVSLNHGWVTRVPRDRADQNKERERLYRNLN